MQRGGVVYILSSKNNSTIYVGVTTNLIQRLSQHRNKIFPESFTSRYNCTKLVYYATFSCIEDAIAEEKRIKGGSRKRKEMLIDSMNPDWKDLWEDVKDW
jgi:putative endonuclease